MRQCALAVCVVSVLVPALAHADGVRDFVGKNVWEKVNARTIYEVAGVKDELVAKLGEKHWATLLKYQVAGSPTALATSPLLGAVVVTDQHLAHDAQSRAVVMLTLAGKLLGACFETMTSDKQFEFEWVGPRLTAKKIANNDDDGCGNKGDEVLAQYAKALAISQQTKK